MNDVERGPRTPVRARRRHFYRGSQSQDRMKQTPNRASKPSNDTPDSRRHSHGLSWNSAARNSVVDNLLMSLDAAFGSSATGEESPGLGQRPGLPRGHTASSLFSRDSSPSRFSMPRRKQDSSSTFRAGTGRIGSLCSDSESTGSGGAALTANCVLDSSKRSFSADEVYTGSVLERGRPIRSIFSAFDATEAAPEPAVPVGPRNKLNPAAIGPVHVRTPAASKLMTDSHTDPRLGSRSNSLIPQHIHLQASNFVRANSMTGEMCQGNEAGNKPVAPTASYSLFPVGRENVPPPRSQSFFRNVFGFQSDSAERRESAQSTPTRSLSLKSQDRVPQQPQPQPPPGPLRPPITLNKKTSSFFRRKKKAAAPAQLTESMPQLTIVPPEPSPSISSLRRVMDPFLNENRPDSSRQTTPVEEDSDDLDMFHFGYTPPPDASLGRRDPISRLSPRDKSKMKIRNKGKKRKEDGASVGTGFNDASDGTSPTTVCEPQTPPELHVAPWEAHPETPQMSDAAFGLSKLRVSTSFDDQPRGRAHERVRSASGEDLKGLTRRPGYAPLPSVRIDEIEASRLNEEIEYRGRARRIFEGDEGDVSQSEAAAWMGEDTEQSSRTLKAYMQLFDFRQMDLLSTLRALCGKLRLSGETQQFDRIISALAERWCQCNPNHGFQAQDVAHTILYSLILLNTDLHVADIGGKMSRAAYVKNTLPTIRRVVTDAAPNAFSETAKAPSTLARPALLWAHSSSSSAVPTSDTSDRSSTDGSASNRLSMWPMSDVWAPSAGANASTTLLSQPWTGSLRAWEVEIEGVLKAFFNSIKSEPLPLLPDTNGADRKLSVTSLGVPRRSRSFSSRSPSEAISFRPKQSLRGMALSWQQRTVRPRPKIYMGSARGSFSRASFDDGGLSKSSLSRALGSPSMDSLGRHTSELAHSVGFANALSQAMIREESTIDSESLSVGAGLLEDEDLALQGAPWAKEGLVKHKHHMESTDRKAKDRGWNDIFAVISKGKLTLFSFKSGTTKTANRHMSRPTVSSAAPRVGGGDWTEQAEQLHYFVLGHCMASVLPPPGYNKTRPHVWALTLPTGAVHLFQVGTPEIAQEFVVTANYWAARLSKEPLVGSVSNLEYGWSDQVINRPPEDTTSPESKHMRSPSNSLIVPLRRPSLAQASIRGSIDAGAAGTRTRLPGDRVVIAQWQPPTQSMTTSSLSEADQLASLQNYIRGVEAELTQHNELKPAIELTYSHRMANYARVSSNWQRKSDYLLRELVKFTSYVDSLHAARAKSEQLRS